MFGTLVHVARIKYRLREVYMKSVEISVNYCTICE